MAGEKTEFGYMKAAGLLAAVVLVLLFFIPRADIRNNIDIETQGIARTYGEKTVEEAVTIASGWYGATVLRTGIYRTLSGISLVGYVGMDGQSETVDAVTAAADAYLRDRTECLFDMWWWFLLRVSMLLVWGPLWIPVFIAAGIDGVCAKRIKLYTFAYTNPSLLVLFRKIISAAAFIIFVGLCVPYAMPALFVPLIFTVIIASLGFVISNFPTRI